MWKYRYMQGGGSCYNPGSCHYQYRYYDSCHRYPDRPPRPPKPQDEKLPESYALKGVDLQLNGAAGKLLEDGASVLFDKVINRQSAGISYADRSGVLRLAVNKNYYVSWWVSVDGTEQSPGVEFALFLNGMQISASAALQVTGQISGASLVTVRRAPESLSLVNTSGSTVRYAPVSVQAGIVIAEVS